MLAFRTSGLALNEVWQDEQPEARVRAAFPWVGEPDTDSMGLVYFEVEPGHSLALHTDSPDEIVIVLSGTARAILGDETAEVTAGTVAFIPSMVPHGFDNIGNDTLKCLGIFASSDVVSTFEYPLQPANSRVVAFKALAPATA
ncbi:MAG TPA: cupin domain-containing protein [Thermomicrobiales bacterium]|nr:cupin domain-containing protein [Thermomicrobiales bacterium]